MAYGSWKTNLTMFLCALFATQRSSSSSSCHWKQRRRRVDILKPFLVFQYWFVCYPSRKVLPPIAVTVFFHIFFDADTLCTTTAACVKFVWVTSIEGCPKRPIVLELLSTNTRVHFRFKVLLLFLTKAVSSSLSHCPLLRSWLRKRIDKKNIWQLIMEL